MIEPSVTQYIHKSSLKKIITKVFNEYEEDHEKHLLTLLGFGDKE